MDHEQSTEQKVSVAEMRMLKLMCRVIREEINSLWVLCSTPGVVLECHQIAEKIEGIGWDC